MFTHISVEVHCLQPRWVELEESRYRLYLDDTLLVERDWLHSIDTFITEQITVEIEKELLHTIRVDVIKKQHTALTQLALRNLIVNDIQQSDKDGHRDNLSFILV